MYIYIYIYIYRYIPLDGMDKEVKVSETLVQAVRFSVIRISND